MRRRPGWPESTIVVLVPPIDIDSAMRKNLATASVCLSLAYLAPVGCGGTAAATANAGGAGVGGASDGGVTSTGLTKLTPTCETATFDAELGDAGATKMATRCSARKMRRCTTSEQCSVTTGSHCNRQPWREVVAVLS